MKKFILSVVFYLVVGVDGHANLTEKIPPKDRQVLEKFFQNLLFGAEFGFTLFGSKPISAALSYSPQGFSSEYIALYEGWETWERYKDEFPSDYFVLKKSTFPEGELDITIINKSALFQVIAENLAIFQLVFEGSTPEMIAQEICDSHESIFEIKSPHKQSIIGLLLGFGRQNSLNFQREIEIIQELNNRRTPPFDAQIESPSPMVQLFLNGLQKQEHIVKRTDTTSSLLEETKEVIDQRVSFEFGKTSFILEKFVVPRFICWESAEETAQLKQTYAQVQLALRKAYANKDFMEVTLQQWVSPKGPIKK